MTFLGFLIDTVRGFVSIPLDKINRAVEQIDSIRNKRSKKATVHELQKLCGFLNFLCRCIMPGRAFTRRLYSKFSSSLAPHLHVRITAEMKRDLLMWQEFLKEPAVYCRPFADFSIELSADDIDSTLMPLGLLEWVESMLMNFFTSFGILVSLQPVIQVSNIWSFLLLPQEFCSG